jgi:hypothetical protein
MKISTLIPGELNHDLTSNLLRVQSTLSLKKPDVVAQIQ